MKVIKGIGVVSLGKVMGMTGALLGLIFGGLYGGIVILISLFGMAGDSGIAAIGVLGGAAMVVGIPLAYGLTMFLGGLLNGVILNFVLGIAGGLEIEIE